MPITPMDTFAFPWLSSMLAFPVLATLPIPFIPDKEGKTLRWYALSVGLIEFALIIYTFWTHYDFNTHALQLTESYSWIPTLGLNFALTVDGLSMPLILLAGFITTLSIFASWKVDYKPRLYYALMLLLYCAQIGVFASKDLLLFFIFWELELVPVYLLIAIWGGKKRRYAATKFILYTALASIFILVAGLSLALYGDNLTFDMTQLGLKDYPLGLECLAYLGFLIAFGAKLPIIPFHTWLPDAHGEASAPISMILAGVLLKMAGYGLIRINMEMLPDAHIKFAPVLVILGIVNILYGAFNAFGQKNLKRRLACSSVSHMGFVLLGIASFTTLGLNGAMLQMISHGLIAAVLFFLSGTAYERTHTLMMDEMSGMGKQMPTIFALFTVGAMASLALPGMSGFVSELTIFLGLSNSDVYTSGFKVLTVFLTAVGVILTPIYLLSMLREVFYGKVTLTLDQFNRDANPREVFIALCMIVPIVLIGVYPNMAMNSYDVKMVQVAEKIRTYTPVFANTMQNNTVAESLGNGEMGSID